MRKALGSVMGFRTGLATVGRVSGALGVAFWLGAFAKESGKPGDDKAGGRPVYTDSIAAVVND